MQQEQQQSTANQQRPHQLTNHCLRQELQRTPREFNASVTSSNKAATTAAPYYYPKPSSPSWLKDKKILYSNLVATTPTSLMSPRMSCGGGGGSGGSGGDEVSGGSGGSCSSSGSNSINVQGVQMDEASTKQHFVEPSNSREETAASSNPRTHRHHHQPHHQDETTINQLPTASGSYNIGFYNIKGTLGKGNFSTVKLAQHRLTQHKVAIKVVKTSVLSEDNLLKINREIEVLKRLGKHNNIVRLYQVIKTKRYFMLVTEYCANGELYDYLVERGKLSEYQSCDYFLQILSAVEYLHEQNVVHRDLKAENLLLTNNYKVIKIADFGFANYFKQDSPLSTWCGSPPYAAPELFKGVKYFGPPVDIWSMGVILYVLVCGSLPFDGHSLVHLKSRVLSGKFRIPFFMSTECEGLIRSMLRLDPSRRFSIRQIRNHCWISKYKSKPNNARVLEKHMPGTMLGEVSARDQNCSNVSMATSNVGSVKNLESKTNARGQSLELEDDDDKSKEQFAKPKINEDASMLCLSSDNSGRKSVPKLDHNQPTKDCINIEIATAVSNISLDDSNNSSMSVSQNIETTSNLNNNSCSSRGVTKMDTSESKCLIKENSIDDQIIDYMVNKLRIAESQSVVHQSIANDRYDDIHAIYRLLKDQPHPLLDTSSYGKEFKVPSLPLISLNKQKCINKPSITTGFFNATSHNVKPNTFTDSNNNNNSANNQNDKPREINNQAQHYALQQQVAARDESPEHQFEAMNLITHHNNESTLEKETPLPQRGEYRQRKSEDQSWKMPPQLFLTPPTENRLQKGCDLAKTDNLPTTEETIAIKKFARHSFDSTMQQLIDSSSSAIPGSSNNQLALTSDSKQCFWDSSILDTLGASNPTVGDPALASNEADSREANGISQQEFDQSRTENPVQVLQNLAGITTNLPQIGDPESALNYHHQNLYNQNMLLGQLNSFALSTAITQSSMLAQQPQTPIEFTPNNLINQNYTVMNNMTLQSNINSNGAPILNLLDPNGLISVLERRASDGNTNGHR